MVKLASLTLALAALPVLALGTAGPAAADLPTVEEVLTPARLALLDPALAERIARAELAHERFRQALDHGNLQREAPVGDGWKMTEAGDTAIGGRLPVNPSGGVLSSNPIGASGMIRFAEAALQVQGKAGEHQIDGARRALGHAYGGGSQFFAMWVVGTDKP